MGFLPEVRALLFPGKDDNNYEEEKKTNAPKYYQIYFETNGGNKISPITIGSQNVTLPNPTKENHTFEGWYLNPELTHQPTYPFTPSEDITLYAKWIKTKVVTTCTDSEIKMWLNNTPSIYYSITPNGLDLQALQTAGYYITVDITYKVHYKKTYDALFDIGYLGSPKYETYLKINDREVASKEDQGTSTSKDTRNISYTARAADFLNKNVKVEFSTNNIQNTIYFTDIVVTYECYK